MAITPTDAIQLKHADTEADWRACFPLMQELRPHLPDSDSFVAQLQRQRTQHYRILAAWGGTTVIGLAGYRLQENLVHGRFVYIDDLVTTADSRSNGIGATLIDAVRNIARDEQCQRLVLDTGMANSLAQRFYFRQGLLASGMHFKQILD